MDTIKWQRNNFIKFYAAMKIRIGGNKDSVDKIEQGDEFEYDGTILKYAGYELATPGIRSAIEKGWAGRVQDSNESIAAVVPTRNIAKATTVNRDLSRVQRGSPSVMPADSLDEETILEVSDRGKTERTSNGQSADPRLLTRNNNRKMAIDRSDLDSQDAVQIGRVRTANKSVTDVTKNPRLAAAIESGEGVGMVGRPELYHQQKTLHAEGVTIRTNVSVDRSMVNAEDEGTVVGRVRHTNKASTEGIDIKDTSNIRTASKSKPVIDTNLPPRIRMARRIDPSFPDNWCFSGKLADRLAAVKAHGASPVFLEALYAAEGDQMRKVLEKEFPDQFS